jgi:hypothetical protein
MYPITQDLVFLIHRERKTRRLRHMAKPNSHLQSKSSAFDEEKVGKLMGR